MEEQEDSADFEKIPNGNGQRREQRSASPVTETTVEGADSKQTPTQGAAPAQDEFEQGTRRWRGRRGRRRGGRPHEHREQQSGQSFESTPIQPSDLHAIQEAISAEPVTLPEHGAPGGIPAGHLPVAELPILLPGESLSRYGRHPAEARPSREESRSQPASHPGSNSFKPKTLVEVPEGWDGGSLLPGETLSRYRSQTPTRLEHVAEEYANPVSAMEPERSEPVESSAREEAVAEPRFA